MYSANVVITLRIYIFSVGIQEGGKLFFFLARNFSPSNVSSSSSTVSFYERHLYSTEAAIVKFCIESLLATLETQKGDGKDYHMLLGVLILRGKLDFFGWLYGRNFVVKLGQNFDQINLLFKVSFCFLENSLVLKPKQ